MRNDTGVREKYIPTDFDTNRILIEIPETAQHKRSLVFLCYVVGDFLMPSLGKSATACQKTILLWEEGGE